MPSSPYRGLRPFEADDAPFFFGRDRERELLAANLVAYDLTVVYGASGVGKSSLLAAGVLHHLRKQAADMRASGAAQFVPVYFSGWRDDPRAGLQRCVRDALEDAGADVGAWDWAEGSLVRTLEDGCALIGGEVLVMLDQLEEYFQHWPDDGMLIAELWEAARVRDLPVHILVSIRDDALSKLDRFKAAVPQLFDNMYRVAHLSAQGAREAIERPLDVYNERVASGERVRIEPALVAAVIEGGADRESPGQVDASQLQLVMTRVWAAEVQAGSQTLRSATLERLGGTAAVVEGHLDGVMATLSDEEREVAASASRALVTPDLTKLALSASNLAWLTSLPEASLTRVLDRLSATDARLLRRLPPPPDRSDGEPRFEASHDLVARALLAWRERYQRQREQQALEARMRDDARLRQRHLRRRVILIAAVLLTLAAIGFGVLQRRLDRSEEALQASRQDVAQSQQTAARALALSLYTTTGSRPRVRGNTLVFPQRSPYASYRIRLGAPPASMPRGILRGPERPDGSCTATKAYGQAVLTWRAAPCDEPPEVRWRAVDGVLRGKISRAELLLLAKETQQLLAKEAQQQRALEVYAAKLAPLLQASARARRDVRSVTEDVHKDRLTRDEGVARMRELAELRASLVTAVGRLPEPPPGEESLTPTLRRAMELSRDAAGAYEAWIASLTSYYDPVPYGYQTPAYQYAQRFTREARLVKQRFLDRYNPFARQFGQREWTIDEI